MCFYVVFLKCQKYVAIKEEWIQNPVIGKSSKVFISNDETFAADFDAKMSYFVVDENMCYNGFIERKCESLEIARRFIARKRKIVPVCYKTGRKFKINVGEIV